MEPKSEKGDSAIRPSFINRQLLENVSHQDRHSSHVRDTKPIRVARDHKYFLSLVDKVWDSVQSYSALLISKNLLQQ